VFSICSEWCQKEFRNSEEGGGGGNNLLKEVEAEGRALEEVSSELLAVLMRHCPLC
jgi:hypothetical protein